MTSETPRPPSSVASAVSSVLRLVMHGAPLSHSLDALCRHLEAACSVDVTAAFTIDDHELRLVGHGTLPPPLSSMTVAEAGAHGTVIARTVTSVVPTVIPDLTTAPADVQRVHGLATKAGLRGLVGVPVAGADGRVLGVLGLATFQPRAWSTETLELADAFADLAGLVLERHRARSGADRAREQAEHLSHRLAATLDAVPTPTFELDRAGRVIRWNRAAAIVAGWRADDVVGRPLTAMGRGWAPMSDRVDDARRGVASTGQVEVVRRDGTELVLEVRLNPLLDDGGATSVIGTLTDLTDRLAMETAVRRSQRMEALGQFAGGIAHDFGNMLAAIAGFADLLELELPEDAADARHDATQIRQIAERGRALTERLLDFAHSRPTAPEPVDVADHARSLERVLDRSLPDACCLVLGVDDTVPAVLLGHGQLDQVLMNLVSNAGDAMPDGGTVTVRIAGTHDRVTIEVEDQGTGIPPSRLDRVFEPFFTTKGARGTGLGLSNVYAIVRGAGGHIEASSRMGRGSTFRIELPAHHASTAVDTATPTASRILVVDPEDVSRQVLRTALVEAGYRVLAVAQADELDLADVARTDPVRVVLCPATAGTPADRSLATLVHRIRQLHPSVALIELGGRDESSRDPGVMTIPRPYVVDQVVATVRQAAGS